MKAIIKQISQGKNAMPAFTGRLTDEQVQNVAAYVLDKSEKACLISNSINSKVSLNPIVIL